MGGEEGGLVQPQNPTNSQEQQHNNNHQFLFQGDALAYAHTLDSNPKAPDLGAARFIQPRCFSLNHQGTNLFSESPVRNWKDGRGGSDSSQTDGDDDDLDEDEEEDDGHERESFAEFGDGSRGKSGRDGGCIDHNGNNSDAVKKDSGSNNNGSSSSSDVTALGGMVKLGNGKTEICFSGENCIFVENSELMGLSDVRATSGEIGSYQNVVAVVGTDGEFYYPHYLDGSGDSGSKRRDVGIDNSNCGFSGRKDFSSSGESGESLRAILSDPVTGTLMEDAMILPCGHSFGSSGVQQVIRMKACATCSQPILEDSILPNHSLREAVQAFLREEELNFQRPSKRRKEKLEQGKGGYNDSNAIDTIRGRGNFPFSVRDRVIIKGNKRTPDRFVGREAIVMGQCLNGWYVVKTLDTAECVKLQYRSLARVSGGSSCKVLPSKMAPNWL